jgi:hypothetical protein
MRRAVRLLSAIVVAAGALALPPSALGQAATVEPFSFTFEEGPFLIDDSCPLGVEGILTGSGVGEGKEVVTRARRNEVVKTVFDYRVEFPDGSYLLASQTERSTFHTEQQDSGVYGGVTQESGSLYGADGTVIGQLRFHAVFHGTLEDGNFVERVTHVRLTCR